MIKPKTTQKMQNLQKRNIIKVLHTPALKKFLKELTALKNQIVTWNLLSKLKLLESNSYHNSGIVCQLSKINVQFQKLMPVNTDHYLFIILANLITWNNKITLHLMEKIRQLFYLIERFHHALNFSICIFFHFQ